MKLNLDLNLDDALVLMNTLNKIDTDFIYTKILNHEMKNMDIVSIKLTIKRIIKSLNNFEKNIDISYQNVNQLMKWFDFYTSEDTKELLPGFNEKEIDNVNRILANLYYDLYVFVCQYELHRN